MQLVRKVSAVLLALWLAAVHDEAVALAHSRSDRITLQYETTMIGTIETATIHRDGVVDLTIHSIWGEQGEDIASPRMVSSRTERLAPGKFNRILKLMSEVGFATLPNNLDPPDCKQAWSDPTKRTLTLSLDGLTKTVSYWGACADHPGQTVFDKLTEQISDELGLSVWLEQVRASTSPDDMAPDSEAE